MWAVLPAVCWCALAPASAAGELSAEAVLGRLQLWLDGTRDLEARFEQELASGALGTGLEESGTLFLLRPGKMRWNYLDPERKVALIDGDTTRLYLEEDRQLWEGRLEEDGGLLPMLLADARPLAELFEATLVATPERGGAGAYRLRLVPRTAADAFRQVVLTLDPPRFGIGGAEQRGLCQGRDSFGSGGPYGVEQLDVVPFGCLRLAVPKQRLESWKRDASVGS